jgi:Flp pilus assembly CpaE family ATPase
MTRVLLLDLNLVTGDSATLFDLTPTYTLADLCLNSDQIDRVMLERSLACHTSGVHVLAAPNSIADVARVNALA